MKLLKNMTGINPIKTVTNKRIPSWGVRPGLPIGTKITIRDQVKIKDLVKCGQFSPRTFRICVDFQVM